MFLCVLAVAFVAATGVGCDSQSHSQPPSPTIEYLLPPTKTSTPLPPPCDVTCAAPTDTPTPVSTAPPTAVSVAAPEDESVSAQSYQAAATGYVGQCGWGYSDTVTQWWSEVIKYDWDPCTVLYIIQHESQGLNVYNTQGSGACGVMQLLPCMYPYDGAANIAYGYYNKYLPAGWTPWAVMG